MCQELLGEVLVLSIAWIFLTRALLSWACCEAGVGFKWIMKVLVSLDAPEQARRGQFVGVLWAQYDVYSPF